MSGDHDRAKSTHSSLWTLVIFLALWPFLSLTIANGIRDSLAEALVSTPHIFSLMASAPDWAAVYFLDCWQAALFPALFGILARKSLGSALFVPGAVLGSLIEVAILNGEMRLWKCAVALATTLVCAGADLALQRMRRGRKARSASSAVG